MNKELSKPGTKNYRKSEECYMIKKKKRLSIKRNYKRNQIETLVPKTTMIEIKNSLEGFNSRFQQAEEGIEESKDRASEITQSEEQKEKYNEEK